MIDREDYSDSLINVRFSIGGLEHLGIKEKVMAGILKTGRNTEYEFTNQNGKAFVTFRVPTQVIPEIAMELAKMNLAIYEITDVKN